MRQIEGIEIHDFLPPLLGGITGMSVTGAGFIAPASTRELGILSFSKINSSLFLSYLISIFMFTALKTFGSNEASRFSFTTTDKFLSQTSSW